MSSERRFNDREIAEIFQQAAQGQETARRRLPHAEGLTLAELQEIGREAGISPEFVARAAATIERTVPPPPPKTFLGLPISASRTVNLPGPLSDEDWERLVADLRETFHARGNISVAGSLRQWSNGNLHALVERTESGHRLRLGTLKGNAQGSLLTSLAMFAMGFVFISLMAVTRDFEPAVAVMMSLFMVLGLGGFGLTAKRLPQWADERQDQMDAIAERVLERMGGRETTAQSTGSGRLDVHEYEDTADTQADRTRRRTRT